MDYLNYTGSTFVPVDFRKGAGFLASYTVWAIVFEKTGKITAAGPHRIFDRISFAPFGS
jgi:hypothetical protein